MLKRIFLGLLLAIVLLVAAVAVKTWTTPSQQLAVAPAPKLDIDVQAAAINSVLNHYRAVLAIRKAHPALVAGSIRFLETEGDMLAFVREGGGERLLCAFNFAEGDASWTLPAYLGSIEAIDFAGYGAALQGGTLHLPGLRAFIGQLG